MNKNTPKIKKFSGLNTCLNEEPAYQEKELAKQNIRTVMQALCGCQKNCAECQEEEWENG